MKIKFPFILLGFGLLLLVLVWYYWYILLPLSSLALFSRAAYLYYLYKQGCVRCQAAGYLQGKDAVLPLHFHDGAPCYFCAGKGFPPKDRRQWHEIAKKAIQKLQRLAVQEELLLQQIEQFRNDMKFVANTDLNIVLAQNKVLSKKFQQLAAIESETIAYKKVQARAFNNAYHIHLIQRLNQERLQIENWEEQSTDELADSLADVTDVTFLQKNEFIPLLEQQNQDYLPLISEPLRQDIDEAVKELQLLINDHRKN